ncbi:hypothetical protein QBC39DRAFT_113449 [Podospora conica]|nr:hypothetical protein QBC39DRAFT_113449 [Schizothecium conicum]
MILENKMHIYLHIPMVFTACRCASFIFSASVLFSSRLLLRKRPVSACAPNTPPEHDLHTAQHSRASLINLNLKVSADGIAPPFSQAPHPSNQMDRNSNVPLHNLAGHTPSPNVDVTAFARERGCVCACAMDDDVCLVACVSVRPSRESERGIVTMGFTRAVPSSARVCWWVGGQARGWVDGRIPLARRFPNGKETQGGGLSPQSSPVPRMV